MLAYINKKHYLCIEGRNKTQKKSHLLSQTSDFKVYEAIKVSFLYCVVVTIFYPLA